MTAAGGAIIIQRYQNDNETLQTIADSRQMGEMKYFPVVFELFTGAGLEAVLLPANYRKRMK